MWGSAVLYAGLVLALCGLVLATRPIRRIRAITRRRALAVAAAGGLLTALAWFLPVTESRVQVRVSRLDEFAPAWQFREFHTIAIAAPPSRVFDAIRRVRADEIALFHTLTWIRRGGREAAPGILNAGSREPLIDVATANGFVRLADDEPRELVIGAIVVAPRGMRRRVKAEDFSQPLPPGYALAAMNFMVTPDGRGGSRVSTETRVFANSSESRRRFAPYWRIIYPGSAIIRRMWLRAIDRRALERAGP